MHKLRKAIEALRQIGKKPYYGYIQGHSHLDASKLQVIKSLVGKQEQYVVEEFENRFTELVGEGSSVAFAAGRMAFFALLREIKIRQGDEVVITGGTCAVMVNAVLRTGATPIYADIDLDTFGSSALAIKEVITPRTRVIVAQHSFGIPCDIVSIAELARRHSIFLIEDCALSVGSKIGGISVGNFGDAAIFSTDHSKPINTILGGLVYSRDEELIERIRSVQAGCEELSLTKQKALWKRILIEKALCRPSRYGVLQAVEYFLLIANKLGLYKNPFLSEDFSPKINKTSYPYPARLPSFLAQLGLFELHRWPEYQRERTVLLQELLRVVNQSGFTAYLPRAYFNNNLFIVPIRFVWSHPIGADFRNSLKAFLHISWTWFMKPIIPTSEPLSRFGYKTGSCPKSECAGVNMVNIPCNMSLYDSNRIVELLRQALSRQAKPTCGKTSKT